VGCLGFSIDQSRNSKDLEGVVEEVGSIETKHCVLVCQTDEQLEMAKAASERQELWN
jgi:acetate kinase